MGATAPRTVGLAIRGPITRADLSGLCDRVCAFLGEASGSVVLCDVHGVEPDAMTVDALCRLQLGAPVKGVPHTSLPVAASRLRMRYCLMPACGTSNLPAL